MGQFKPMVKMMTTEPSVELKLKTGGSATFARMKAEGIPKMSDKKPVKKMDGGMMGALAGRSPVVPPMGAPSAARAMAAKRMARRAPGMAGKAAMPPMPARPAMKKGGEMESPKMHKAEMQAIKGVGKELKAHEGKPASKAHKGLKTGGIAKSTKPGAYKTGGVVDGQGGYKSGGIIKSTKDISKKVNTAHPDHNSAPTGKVKMGNAGGYKKGGKIKMAEGGGLLDRLGVGSLTPGRGGSGGTGYSPDTGGGSASSGLNSVNQGAQTIGGALKNIASSVGGGGGGGGRYPMPGPEMPEMMAKRGGKVSKKHFATGGAVNDSGHAVAMPKKKPSAPVAISQLSGTFKRGGKVKADDC
jgi:hypothetical protein